MQSNEAYSRVAIDAQLADQGWRTHDPNSVRYEVVLGDGTRADYVLCDRHGRSMAVIEAKRDSINPGEAETQARSYARQLGVPYVFLANGREIRFWEWSTRTSRVRSRLSSSRRILNAALPPDRYGAILRTFQ